MVALLKSKMPGCFNWRRSSWFLLLIILSFFSYFVSSRGHHREIAEHQNKLSDLQEEKESLFAENQDLKLRINSQSDPAWIELILMKELGVVPEGRLKVHFTQQK